MNKRNFFVFLLIVTLPFLILVGIYIGKADNVKRECKAKDRQELLKDTAKVNAAHRTYEKVSLQLLSEETEVQELTEGVLEMKDKFERISLYVNDAERILDRLEYKRTDVSDLREILENIKNECESPTN